MSALNNKTLITNVNLNLIYTVIGFSISAFLFYDALVEMSILMILVYVFSGLGANFIKFKEDKLVVGNFYWYFLKSTIMLDEIDYVSPHFKGRYHLIEIHFHNRKQKAVYFAGMPTYKWEKLKALFKSLNVRIVNWN